MDIRIAAAAITRADGATLLVRKRGTSAFMQPGGKIDAGETPVIALCRELYEELGITLEPQTPEYLGCFDAPAANEPDAIVVAELFKVQLEEEVEVQAEIEEARWVSRDQVAALELAPLTRDKVLPTIWG